MAKVAKRTRQVENRIKNARSVIQSARSHGPAVAQSLTNRAAPLMAGEMNKDSVQQMFSLLASLLEAATTELDQAEEACVSEKADDVPIREQRDELAAALIGRMTRLRSVIVDRLGDGGLRTYGLTGATPRIPSEIASHANNVAQLFTNAPVNFSTDGLSFDSTQLVPSLKAQAATLNETLAMLEREERELQDAIGRRDRVILSWTDSYQGVANTLTGLFRLAGRADLAEKVRPTARKASGEEAPSEDEGEGEGRQTV